ncbi:hypothetical protein K7432_017248 [Basidiobolus ranarum]|uniref:Uncharacterized protein n=1 Tax=Basidiobolus ranarum TaxID=34480 RepID=A0ABR2WDL2_9FUNG
MQDHSLQGAPGSNHSSLLCELIPNGDATSQEMTNPAPILNGRRLSIEQVVYHNSMASQHEAKIKELTQD